MKTKSIDKPIERFLSIFGSKVISFFIGIGGISLMVKSTVLSLPMAFKRRHLIFEQMVFMGINSLPLVIFTSIFTGAVSALQAAYQFHGYVPLRYLGTAVGKAVVIELGPVLTGLVVAGRVGAAIAAELGTMKVTEQIDALETMALDPVEFLVMPRTISGVVMLPVLTVFSDFVAILGGLTISVFFIDVSSYTFLNGMKQFFELKDLFAGLIKAGIFGIIIAFMGCYQGFITEGGAEGVGRSTTRAVVYASVLILVSDYLVANLLFG